MEAIRDGLSLLAWETETFAYAQAKDETTGHYHGLTAGEINVQVEEGGLLVKPGVAIQQISKENAPKKREGKSIQDPGRNGISPASTRKDETEDKGQHGDRGVTPVTLGFHRFYGSVKLDPLRISRDAGRIADEVIQHLTKLVDAEVEVTLEIQARLSKGASDKTVRDVTENCRTLHFDSFGFEEE